MSFVSAAIYEPTLAGPDYLDAASMHRDEAKSAGDLGLGLPTGVLHTSLGVSESVGLGIYIDFENWDGLLVSPVPSTDSDESDDELSPSVSSMSEAPSPPMLGTRLARPAPPQDSFWSEYAPLRTPSASQLFASMGRTPPVEQQLTLPMLASGSTLPSTESIASGLNLLCLDDEEMVGYVPPPAAIRRDAGVGLGLSLADMEGPELVHTLYEHGLRDLPATSSVVELLSHPRDELDQPASPPALPHLAERYNTLTRMAQPKARPALMGLGFDLNGSGWEMDEVADAEEGAHTALGVEESSASSTSVEVHGLGFDSPFWVSYAATLNGEA